MQHWEPIKHLWAWYIVMTSPHFGFTTNNTVESHNAKIKRVLNHHSKLADVLRQLFLLEKVKVKERNLKIQCNACWPHARGLLARWMETGQFNNRYMKLLWCMLPSCYLVIPCKVYYGHLCFTFQHFSIGLDRYRYSASESGRYQPYRVVSGIADTAADTGRYQSDVVAMTKCRNTVLTA